MVETTKAACSLGGDEVRELWCWLWAGIAERECRIWRELSSSRDIRKEKRACQQVQQALVVELPVSSGHFLGEGLFSRLGLGLAAEATSRLRVDLESEFQKAKADASRKELGGNEADAMELVLHSFLPLFDRLAARAETSPPRTPGLDLSPASAFEFLAWLGCTLQTLEVASLDARNPAEQEDLARATAAMRMLLAQWIASLPPSPTAYGFHDTWGRLVRGLEAARLKPLAGWLGAETARYAGDDDTRARLLHRAFKRLALVAGLSPELLRSFAPSCPMPWTPPTPMPSALLGGSKAASSLLSFTVVEGQGGPERFKVPLHQFIAGLVRN